MVYHGPSRGCRACRKRRVKCDQLHPACNNCTKRKQECPGYESPFDYRHRNETKTTINRAQQKGASKSRKSHSSPETSSSEGSPSSTEVIEALDETGTVDPTGFALVVANSAMTGLVEPDVQIPLNVSLRPDPEGVALSWYFTNYPMKNVDPQAIHGYFQILKPMYLASSMDSPLRPAVAAVATNLLMLFCYQGGDTDWARSFYAQSVSKMKNMISDPVESKSDDLMLSTLILNFYDMVNSRWSSNHALQTKHREGAMALFRHRGDFNHNTETGKLLTASIRSSICHWALENRTEIGPEIMEFLTEESLPNNKANELDLHSLELVKFQTDFIKFCRVRRIGATFVDVVAVRELIQRGLEVDELLMSWYRSCPAHWSPLYVTADEMPQTLREVALYGDRCSVYWDLPICDISNRYRMRRIILCRMIRQICIDNFDPSLSDVLALVDANIHQMGNELLESIAFITGDVSDSIQHARLYDINYPSASNGVVTFPNIEHDHPRAAASSGGWIASTVCGLLAKLVYRDELLDAFPVTEIQYTFVLQQLKRLQHVFMVQQSTSYVKRSKWYEF